MSRRKAPEEELSVVGETSAAVPSASGAALAAEPVAAVETTAAGLASSFGRRLFGLVSGAAGASPPQRSVEAPAQIDMPPIDLQQNDLQRNDLQQNDTPPIDLQQKDPEHDESQHSAPEHGESQHSAPEHGESQQSAPEHGESQQSGPGHGESQRISQQLGESQQNDPQHAESQQISPQHAESQLNDSPPGVGEPQQPGGGEPQQPGGGEPQQPGGGEPQQPVAGEPQQPSGGESLPGASELLQGAVESQQGAVEPQQGAVEPPQGAVEPLQGAADPTEEECEIRRLALAAFADEPEVSEIPIEAEAILSELALSGCCDAYFWPHLRLLLARVLERNLFSLWEGHRCVWTVDEVHLFMSEVIQPLKSLLQDAPGGAPWTLQRLCELLAKPRPVYRSARRYAYALSQCLLVLRRPPGFISQAAACITSECSTPVLSGAALFAANNADAEPSQVPQAPLRWSVGGIEPRWPAATSADAQLCYRAAAVWPAEQPSTALSWDTGSENGRAQPCPCPPEEGPEGSGLGSEDATAKRRKTKDSVAL